MLTLRAANDGDWPAIWEMFQQVIAGGDSFAYDADTTEAVAHKLWVEAPAWAHVAELEGKVAGTYYVRPNQPGRGAHVANAGYMVAAGCRGQGIASILCEHSIQSARQLGFHALQFNFVVSTNVAAIHVWEKHGFGIVGRIPRAFQHDRLGLVDALVFYREL